jgi:preprotein translocase subunit SecE
MADTVVSTQSTDVERKSFAAKVTGFFTDVNKEMKKVTWPTREQLQEATLVTLALCVVASIFVFGVDKIFEIVLRLLYGI